MKTKTKKENASSGVVIDLQPEEKRALRNQARRFGVSTTDFVRSVVSQYYGIDVARR